MPASLNNPISRKSKRASLMLNNLKVLDLSRVLAGPWTSQSLADLGADVIKIERPGVGDDTRAWGPLYFESANGDLTSAYFMSANRGKRSAAINIATPQGQALVQKLAQQSDIVIENYKAGDLARRGLDYPTLSKTNPGLIYCSITGFGQSGPNREKPGYDFIIQAMGGLMSITGAEGSEPQKVGVALADILTGLYSTIAILAALNRRNETGEGEHIDMALFDTQLATLANQASNFLVSGQAPRQLGNAHPNIVPYQSFSTADERIAIAVGNDNQFKTLCRVLGNEHLASERRFATNSERVAHHEELVNLLQDLFAVRGATAWIELLEADGVPCGRINTIEQAFSEPQSIERELVREIDGMPLVANPIRFMKNPITYDRAPPHLGQHTNDILETELGLTNEEITALHANNIVG